MGVWGCEVGDKKDIFLFFVTLMSPISFETYKISEV